MSGRFVRKSSFRHVHGEAAKPEGCFLNTNVECSGDGNYICGNDKFLAYAPKTGGGGPVVVLDRSKPGRFPTKLPNLVVHKRRVLDFAFNPFNDNLLATASEDCMLKVSQIPDGGLTESSKASLVDMKGHEKKVVMCSWHPTANNVLASAGFDKMIKLWDVSSGTCKLTFKESKDAIQHIAWSRDGSQMAATSKDKTLRLFDPRAPEAITSTKPFAGSKKSSVVYLSAVDQICTIGFTRTSMRQIKIYDPRNMAEDLWTQDLDQSAGVMIPHYDHDTSILFVGGKGDGTIKYFEVTNDNKHLHFLSSYSGTSSHKGFCFLPKTSCDTSSCEIASCLRVLRDQIIPVHFQVPRKSGADMFQSDIFPDTACGPPAIEAAEYFEGKNGAPNLVSMDPEQRSEKVVTEFVAKKSYDEIEAELAAALARIAELEAQLA